MLSKKYRLRYLPLFYEDLDEKVTTKMATKKKNCQFLKRYNKMFSVIIMELYKGDFDNV